MLDNIFLVTSVEIATDAISSFIRKFGGVTPLDSPGEGWIQREDCYLSISFGQNTHDPNILADALGDREEEINKNWERLLETL